MTTAWMSSACMASAASSAPSPPGSWWIRPWAARASWTTPGGQSVYPGTGDPGHRRSSRASDHSLLVRYRQPIVFGLIKMRSACGSRKKSEREGLDIAEHGERAYNA